MERGKAIVVGATSGIGWEVAQQLAAAGWQVGIAGRREERLQEMARTTEGIVAYRRLDITDEQAPQQLQALIEAVGGMNLYFHSSGIGWQNIGLDAEKELRTVETNGMGFVRMVTTAFHWMADHRQKGHIACITSIAGTKGLGPAPAYSATKRFQSHYLECLEQLVRMRHLPITFTDIRPGFVATDLIAGGNYPMKLQAADVARQIIRAIHGKKRVVVIDWRYRLLVFFWRMIPSWLWIRLRLIRD